MSTSPSVEDRLITTLSQWLARHVTSEQLLAQIRSVSGDSLGPDGATLIAELRVELGRGAARADVEMVAREALEALALGA